MFGEKLFQPAIDALTVRRSIVAARVKGPGALCGLPMNQQWRLRLEGKRSAWTRGDPPNRLQAERIVRLGGLTIVEPRQVALRRSTRRPASKSVVACHRWSSSSTVTEINGSQRGSTMKRIIFCSLASAIFAMAIGNADAAARKHHPSGHYDGKTWSTEAHQRPSVRRSVDGDLIDRDGWRHGKSWDNTCFRTLDYLSSMSACTGGGAG